MMKSLLRLLAILAWLPLAHADILPRTAKQLPVARYGQDAVRRIVATHLLRCGVISAAEDYSMASTHGDLSHFGVALCRATAAALLGHPDQVSLTGYPDDAHGLRAVQGSQIDVLFGVTPDAASALPYDVAFGPTMFFDAQAVMVRRQAGITRPEQIAGKPLCYITGTSQEARMNDWAQAAHVTFISHDFQERGEMDSALITGSCTAVTDDASALAQVRAGFNAPIADFMILQPPLAIDAWAPAMRAGETRLNAVLTDVFAALVTGEAIGITAANASVPHPGAQMLLGPTPGIATTLQMPNGWAARAIMAGGNYAELYDGTLGAWHLPRGVDALWFHGGLLTAPPLR